MRVSQVTSAGNLALIRQRKPAAPCSTRRRLSRKNLGGSHAYSYSMPPQFPIGPDVVVPVSGHVVTHGLQPRSSPNRWFPQGIRRWERAVHQHSPIPRGIVITDGPPTTLNFAGSSRAQSPNMHQHRFPSPEPELECCYVQHSKSMAVEEARLQLALIA
jgi:hypothetical protein